MKMPDEKEGMSVSDLLVPIRVEINGIPYEKAVKPFTTLLDLIREEIGLKGTKRGCDNGQCGACTVIMDGKAVSSCLLLAVQADGKKITTIEGLSQEGALHPLQEAFVENGAVQCGFCTPGMIMSAKALLDEKKFPSENEIKEALSGNLCRCSGYAKIIGAVKQASESLKA